MRISSLTALLIGWPLFQHAAAVCPSGLGRKCKECTNENSGWETDCTLRVSMTCTFYDENGVQQSCFPDNADVGNQTPEPRFSLSEAECRLRPADHEYEATVIYEMCSVNSLDFTPRADPVDAHGIKFADDRTIDPNTSVDPSNWFNVIAPGQCRTHVEVRTIKPCESDFRGLSIAMDGVLSRTNPNYCRCFLREFIRSEVVSSPAFSPTNEGPVATPSTGAVPGVCDEKKVIITEIAAPYNAPYAHYIELYWLDEECRGQTITEEVAVSTVGLLPLGPFNVTGATVRDDGFITICNSETAESYYGTNSCTLVSGMTDPAAVANLYGWESVVVGNSTDNFDTYGYPLQLSNSTIFTNGRAVRKLDNTTVPLSEFDIDQWNIFPGECGQWVGFEGMDPNEWVETQGPICKFIITEIVDLDYESTTAAPRYVEIHAPSELDRGDGFDYDLKLVIFHSDDTVPDWNSAVPINYMPENGFLVVCNAAAYARYGSECAVVSTDLGSPANSNGNDQIALISGDEKSWFVVDIFGVIGEDGYGTDHYFNKARVIRKLDVVKPIGVEFSSDKFTICSLDSVDPNSWDTDVCGQGLDAPSSQPTMSPTTEAQNDCEFFFTELSDIDNSPFIEIKTTCPGAKISRPLTAISYKQYGQSCEIDLQGMVVPADGFIILCRSKIEHAVTYGNLPNYECDIEDNQFFIGHGDNSYAIADFDSECDRNDCDGSNCSFGCDDKYLDVYGFLGASLEGTIYSYNDCRVNRKTRYPYGLYPFDPSVFDIICRTTTPDPGQQSDPRDWSSIETILYISEICDPKDDSQKKFIEIYSPNKRNYVIDEDIIVVKFTGSSLTPSYYYQPLRGKEIDENGFLVICQDLFTFGSSSCDIATSPFGIANLSGTDHFALYRNCLTPSLGCDEVDIYGVPGTSAQDSAQDFSGGRVFRLQSMDVPISPFDMSQWVVQRNLDAYMCDPGRLTPPPAPTAPTGSVKQPSPSGPSNYKGGKKPSKSKKRIRA